MTCRRVLGTGTQHLVERVHHDQHPRARHGWLRVQQSPALPAPRPTRSSRAPRARARRSAAGAAARTAPRPVRPPASRPATTPGRGLHVLQQAGLADPRLPGDDDVADGRIGEEPLDGHRQHGDPERPGRGLGVPVGGGVEPLLGVDAGEFTGLGGPVGETAPVPYRVGRGSGGEQLGRQQRAVAPAPEPSRRARQSLRGAPAIVRALGPRAVTGAGPPRILLRPVDPPVRPCARSTGPPDPLRQQRIVRERPRRHGPQLGDGSGTATGVGGDDSHQPVPGEQRGPRHSRPAAAGHRARERAGRDDPVPGPHPRQRVHHPAELPGLAHPVHHIVVGEADGGDLHRVGGDEIGPVRRRPPCRRRRLVGVLGDQQQRHIALGPPPHRHRVPERPPRGGVRQRPYPARLAAVGQLVQRRRGQGAARRWGTGSGLADRCRALGRVPHREYELRCDEPPRTHHAGPGVEHLRDTLSGQRHVQVLLSAARRRRPRSRARDLPCPPPPG